MTDLTMRLHAEVDAMTFLADPIRHRIKAMIDEVAQAEYDRGGNAEARRWRNHIGEMLRSPRLASGEPPTPPLPEHLLASTRDPEIDWLYKETRHE